MPVCWQTNLPTKICPVKAIVFPVVMYGCESWTIKESWSEVTQSCLTLCDPVDCSLPGSSVHGIFQAIVLEWIAISFSRGSTQPRDWTRVSRIVDRLFTVWATREARKERWVLKNCCFWSVVLEKTLESPLDSMEIKPVNPKGNQAWIIIWRTDAEAETSILWPPDVKSQLAGKDPDSMKDWGQEEKGTTEDEKVGGHQWFNGHELSKLWEVVNNREVWHAAVPGVTKSLRHDWVTEQQHWLAELSVLLTSLDKIPAT